MGLCGGARLPPNPPSSSLLAPFPLTRVVERYPKHGKLLKCYGTFLEDVKNDFKNATKVYAEATRQGGSGNGILSMEFDFASEVGGSWRLQWQMDLEESKRRRQLWWSFCEQLPPLQTHPATPSSPRSLAARQARDVDWHGRERGRHRHHQR